MAIRKREMVHGSSGGGHGSARAAHLVTKRGGGAPRVTASLKTCALETFGGAQKPSETFEMRLSCRRLKPGCSAPRAASSSSVYGRYVLLPNKLPPKRFEAHLEVHAGSVDERGDEQVRHRTAVPTHDYFPGQCCRMDARLAPLLAMPRPHRPSALFAWLDRCWITFGRVALWGGRLTGPRQILTQTFTRHSRSIEPTASYPTAAIRIQPLWAPGRTGATKHSLSNLPYQHPPNPPPT